MLLLNPLARRSHVPPERKGATIAETAIVLPVFFLILFAFIEFGHVFMVIHTLNAAAQRAARSGISETATTASVTALANQVVGTAIRGSTATIFVKDGAAFDVTGVNASTINYATLPNLELSTAARRQLFIVRVSVPYSDVAILGPKWLAGLIVYGQCVMRRE